MPKKEKARALESLPKGTKPDAVEPVSVALEPYSFNSIIRQIKRNSEDRVLILKACAFEALKQIGVKRDMTKAVAGPAPDGSDQGDGQSFVVWVRRIEKSDKAAVEQLLAIDATATARIKGV